MNTSFLVRRFVPLRYNIYRIQAPFTASRRCYLPLPFRRDPFTDVFRELEHTMRNTTRLFEDMERQWFGRSSGFWRPWQGNWFERELPVETKADGTRLYRARFDMSGFSPENVKVSMANRTVTIRASHESTSEQTGVRQMRDYVYEFSLPESADLEQIKSYIDETGTLNIEATLPKLEPPKSKVHELEIERNDGKAEKK